MQSQSTPTIPAKGAIFEDVELDDYNSYKPQIKTNNIKRSSKELSNNKSRNSGKYTIDDDEVSPIRNNGKTKRKHKGTFSSNGYGGTPIDSRVTNDSGITRISHSQLSHTTRSMITNSSYSSTNISRSSVSESMASGSLNLIDTINHISNHDSNDNIIHQNGYGHGHGMILGV